MNEPMSDLNAKISELEQELALKKAYQQVQFVWPKSAKVDKDVAEAVSLRLRASAEQLALDPKASVNYAGVELAVLASLTKEEVDALKLVATTVVKKAAVPTTSSGPSEAAEVPIPGEKAQATPGGASTHRPSTQASPRKAKIITAENVRGEGKKFAVSEDEVYVPNPDKVDDHGMVSATHMRRGVMLKIPVEDLEFLT